MKQVLLIFRKDCQRFWPEILLSLAVSAAFVWVWPNEWLRGEPANGLTRHFLDLRHLQILAVTVATLLPMSWLLLISRTVHDENLIGYRQFWRTRPYLWQAILTEKLLLIVLFICIPFSLCQLALLHRAGFSPVSFVSNMIYSVTLISMVAVLPLFALASVHSSLLRVIGTLLVFSLLVVGIAFLFSSDDSNPSLSIPMADHLSQYIIGYLCAGVLLIQYSTRKVWVARALLLTGVLSIALLAASPFDNLLFPHYYPEGAEVNDFSLSIAQDPRGGLTVTKLRSGHIVLRIPYKLSGLPPGVMLSVDNVRLTIESQGSVSLASTWQAVNSFMGSSRFKGNKGTDELSVTLPSSAVPSNPTGPVTLRIDLAFTEVQAGIAKSIIASVDEDLSVPLVGQCRFPPSASSYITELQCKVAFHQPDLVQVSVEETPEPCESGSEEPKSKFVASTWTGTCCMNSPT